MGTAVKFYACADPTMSIFTPCSPPTPRRSLFTSAAMSLGSVAVTDSGINNLGFKGSKEKIKGMFDLVELSVSPYDTAWVAMVPSPNSPKAPFFPECLYWILDNQSYDGSWSLPRRHPLLTKDALSSTLACILALRRWDIGEEQMKRGLQFIDSNFASVKDETQYSPIGFDIIFSGMIEYAKDLRLNLPLGSTEIDAMLQKRDGELRREISDGKKAYLAYVSEGLGKLQDWEMVMKYQQKNGSLFNSPSTTAAAFTHLQDDGCLCYLRTLLEKFGNAVPTIYPFSIDARLRMVETIQSLGIDWQYRDEIKSVLDETYRCWLQGEEDIFLDPATCAMAFRILRMNGYDVSSDSLAQYAEYSSFPTLGGSLKDTDSVLELFRASQMIISLDEPVLVKLNSWTSRFLKHELSKASVHADGLGKHTKHKVNYALEFPYHANLQRLARRKSIETYAVDQIRILKTSYRSLNNGNKDLLKLAVQEFNSSQSTYREELKHLESWVKEKRLDKLKFARQKLAYCYFSAAATLCSPELSDARMSWAKNGVLTTVVDDFFDIAGSEEELVNLIQLVETYNGIGGVNCCSEHVEIIFSAIWSTIREIGERAVPWQGRDVTSHVTEIWLDLLKSMLQEARWLQDKSVPTIDNYMANAYVSFALGPIILPSLYFVGPRISEEQDKSNEYNHLFKLVSSCGRLLNDIQGFKRESKEGKLNAVSLNKIHDPSDVSEEEIIDELKNSIYERRVELFRLVLLENGSVLPRACKDLFWNMCQVLHLFYMKDDGFTKEYMMNVVKSVIYEPVSRDDDS
nr:ent-kaurene synthase 1 [Cistus creticus subsp. creticus]